MAESWDSQTRDTVKKIPLLTENSGPRDPKEKWDARLKQVRVCALEQAIARTTLALFPSVGPLA